MLKKRIIPILLLKNKRLVKGKKFLNYRDTGDPASCIKIYNTQYPDELVFINIDDNRFKSNTLFNILKFASKQCFIPLTVGGGIDKISKIEKLLKSGADKIIINTINFKDKKFIYRSSKIFGSQCIVVGIDVRKIKNKYYIYSDLGKEKQNISIEDFIKFCEDNGAGEFFINSIDNDGTMNGYDLKLINHIEKLTKLPIITSGGAGNFKHIEDLFKKTKSSGAACGSIFHFADNNPIRISTYLKQRGIDQKKIK
ncbi:imidazole glycerol phosphate synthase subunit HisF [Candidatus Pelagibacter sp.]|uniref:imidazole glycerol phosphate synthase subunit HisF n=1 Tax=Candidatus Pelagibacter sp. TaxID=2024849 RepID=UPI003F862B4A